MKKKIMTMLISALCLVTASLNSANVVCAADEETNVPILMGDVNNDGSFNVADVVLLQKWLLAVPDTHLANWKAANFCEDDRLDVFDLTLMKRALLAKMNERSSISLQTYDTYKEFIEQNDLPEEFVEYEQLKAIGSFNSLVFLSDARNSDYSEYMYGFSESSKNTVFLTIVPSSKENTSVISTPLSIDDIDQSDMRFTKNKEVSGIFKIDNLSYKYIKGTLLSIMWEKNDLRYTLSCASTFSDYQLNQDSFTSKLLIYDIAGNTFKQFDNNEAVIIPDNPERSTITLQTYDTYKEFIEQNDLPEGFVDYEQVKAIGSFNSLVFLSDARNADYSEYMYGFTESSKNTVFLTIVPSSKEKTSVISTPLSIDDINQSDMRFTKNKEVSGIFKIDDLSYKYIKGTLLSIMWEKNNLRYTLSCASTFSDYQLNMDSYVSKLLFYKSDVAERDTYSIAGKIFAYEKEGAGGYCTLSFNENGRFLYSPGKLSSYMDGGDWKTDGDIVSLIGMADKTIYLKITDDTLVYIAEGSDEFPYMDIKDGEKFVIYRPEISADKFQLNSRYSEYGLGDPKVELDLIVSELPEFCYVEDVRLYDEDDNFIGMMSPAMDADIWNYLVDCHVTEECSKTYYTLSKIRCGGKTYLDDVRSEITVNFKATPAP